MRKTLDYFTKFEQFLWLISIFTTTISFLIFKQTEYLYLVASHIGITALIFLAKGNPIGQLLIIIFSVFYGLISLSYQYYGEMITYIGMTAPIALIALVTWIKHPYKGHLREVEISLLSRKSYSFIIFGGLLATLFFYFILNQLSTPNIVLSSLSIFTSFTASILTLKRSKYYALAYALNDLVLIWLWLLASINQVSYMSLVICFIAFFINDLYGFINWSRIYKKQSV